MAYGIYIPVHTVVQTYVCTVSTVRKYEYILKVGTTTYPCKICIKLIKSFLCNNKKLILRYTTIVDLLPLYRT